MEISKRISLKIGILENCMKIKAKKIKFENYLKEIGILKIKFKNWDFKKLNSEFWNFYWKIKFKIRVL